MIDIGEATAAIVGAQAIVFRSFKELTPAQQEQIKGMDAHIQGLAKQLCRGTLTGPSISSINYDKWLEELPKQPKEEDLGVWFDAFTPEQHAVATAFQGQALRVITYLRTIFPVQPIVTVTSTTNVTPPEVAVGKFAGQLDLLDRAPDSLFELVAEDSLTTSMALDFMKVFPNLYVACTIAIVQAIQAEKFRAADFEPEWERSLACLLGIPGMDPGLRQQLQVPVPDQGKPQPPSRQTSGEGNPAHLIATPSQSASIEQRQ